MIGSIHHSWIDAAANSAQSIDMLPAALMAFARHGDCEASFTVAEITRICRPARTAFAECVVQAIARAAIEFNLACPEFRRAVTFDRPGPIVMRKPSHVADTLRCVDAAIGHADDIGDRAVLRGWETWARAQRIIAGCATLDDVFEIAPPVLVLREHADAVTA